MSETVTLAFCTVGRRGLLNRERRCELTAAPQCQSTTARRRLYPYLDPAAQTMETGTRNPSIYQNRLLTIS
jgi:hypothetical protein